MKSDIRHHPHGSRSATAEGSSANPMLDVFDLIDKISKRGEQIVTRTVSEAGLTPAQYLVLASLRDKGGRPLGEIAEVLRCTPSTITGIVDTMERKDLVVREDNPEDRRSHLLCLTPKGRALRRASPKLDEFYAGCTLGMSQEEFEGLRVLLLRLDECLSVAGGEA